MNGRSHHMLFPILLIQLFLGLYYKIYVNKNNMYIYTYRHDAGQVHLDIKKKTNKTYIFR